VGAEQEPALDEQGWDDLLDEPKAGRKAKRRRRYRRLSCFSRGLITLTVAVLQANALPLGHFVPFDWPHQQEQGESQKTSP